MDDISALQVATYLLGLFFVIAFVSRMIRYSKMPAHLRWELYPIVGESKRPWGGSYLEDVEWWNKPRGEKSLLAEVKFMGKEILLFKEYFHKNRSLWLIIYPFHMGVFLFVGFFALLIAGALSIEADIIVAGNSPDTWGEILYYLTLVAGVGGLILGSIGCLGLFWRKLGPNMRPYTRRIEFLNILIVLAIFLTGLFSWIFADSTFDDARGYMNGLITLGDTGSIDAIIAIHIVLLALFLAYMPFTNIIHFFTKHFTYNSVRWEDAPHLPGSEMERKIQPLLEQPVTWSAPHIKGVGINKWGDIPHKTGRD